MLKAITIKGITYLIYFCFNFNSVNLITNDTSTVVFKNKSYKPDSTIYVDNIETARKDFKFFKRKSIDSINRKDGYSSNPVWKNFKFRYVIVKRTK